MAVITILVTFVCMIVSAIAAWTMLAPIHIILRALCTGVLSLIGAAIGCAIMIIFWVIIENQKNDPNDPKNN